jgi:GntR family transcriptional regulator/MocR family aminotransferase
MPSLERAGFAPLDPDSKLPLYRQIYERFRNAIASGVLKPGDRIPSGRALTQELGLARGTVDAAYSLLAAEGYVQARGQAGTIVTPGLVLPSPAAPPDVREPLEKAGRAKKKAFLPLDTEAARTASVLPDGPDAPRAGGPSWSPAGAGAPAPIRPFQMGLPALDAFPRKIWARLGARCVRAMQPVDMAYPLISGAEPLRREIAAYLQVARGIACRPAQIFITAGYRQTLTLIVQTLLKAGDKVWLEDPGFPPTRELLAHAGLRGVPVPVDQDGIIVAQGLKRAPRAKAAVVTPSHQSPLCVSLALPRRLALLDWAARNEAWIVEDDYDGEYRYISRPLPALKSLDRDGRVLYAGTFSKVLFPSIRLAYLVVPESQVEAFELASAIYCGATPALTQAIITAFIREGHFARHIQRMRKLYGERREAAAAGLGAVLGARARIDPQPGGMHLVVRLNGRLSDRVLAQRMRDDGLYASALSDWSIADAPGSALLLNFTNIGTRQMAEALGRRILKLL